MALIFNWHKNYENLAITQEGNSSSVEFEKLEGTNLQISPFYAGSGKVILVQGVRQLYTSANDLQNSLFTRALKIILLQGVTKFNTYLQTSPFYTTIVYICAGRILKYFAV